MAYDKDKVFDEICDRISKGESLRSVLRDSDMPTRKTFYSWMRDKEGNDVQSKVNQYARATEDRADTIFDEMFDIADDGTNDYVKKSIGDGVEVDSLNSEHIQRSRLRIDTRKWALSKMMPKKYGDKSSVDLTTKGESITDNTQDLSGLSTEDLKTFEELQSKIEKK